MKAKALLSSILATLCLATAALALELPIGLQKIIEHNTQLALSITFLAAFIAGATTILSPCGFVLLPMFISYAFQEKKKAVAMTSYFSIGLIAAFTIFGVIAGLLGNFFNTYKTTFAFIAGFILIGLGLLLFFNKGYSFFTPKIDGEKTRSAWGMLSLGFLFAIGWTPCVGTILGGILVLAGLTGSLLKAMAMMAIYGLGSAVPLMFLAYFSDKTDFATKIQGKVREVNIFGKKVVTNTYNIIGSVLLIGVGGIMVIYRGTQFFQIYLPWNMAWWNTLNQKLLEGFWTSGTANAIGILLAVIFLGTIIFVAQKNFKN